MKNYKKVNKMFLVGVVALVLSFGGLSSCATYATVTGAPTPFGVFTPASVNANRGEVIAQYSIILGLITGGYEDFLRQIDGQEVDLIDTNYFYLFRVVKAVKRN
jgi:hypothetical protein